MSRKKIENLSLFSRKLIALRNGRHLSQEQLAEAVGVTRQMISYFETRSPNPTIDVVKKFADFFGVASDEFIYEAPQEIKKTGPKSTIERKLEAIRNLPKEEQTAISTVLDMALGNLQSKAG